MPDRSNRTSQLPNAVTELWELLIAYVKQETVDPLKKLGRYVAMGVTGAILLGLGLVLLVMAGLRALQDETGTTFTGNWSWVPYAIVLIVGVAVMALLWSFTQKRKQRSR